MFFISAVLFVGCANSLFYNPNKIVYKTPGQYNLRYEDIMFKSKDGTELNGWFVFSIVGEVVGTVIYFHGNFGNLTYYFEQVHWLPAEGFNVFIFDYRGYGKSAGVPSRKGLFEDSVAAIEYITSRANDDLFVLAQSLGGANAIAAIANNTFPKIKAIAIEGTFYSYRKEAQDMMAASVRKNIGEIPCLSLQILPISFLLISDYLSPGKFIDQLTPIPLLIIHGTSDRIVPYHHGIMLYNQAKEPKQLLTNRGNHLETFTKPDYIKFRKKLVGFFKKPVAKIEFQPF